MAKSKKAKKTKNEDPSNCINEKELGEKYPRAMNIYRDIEGNSISKIEDKHLYFPCWINSRIDPKACLPIFYATGPRFIKLEMEEPLGYRCKTFPMNLKEVHATNASVKEKARKEREEQVFRKKVLEECKKKGTAR